MTSVLVVLYSLVFLVSSQCNWTATNPDNGQQVFLNLTPLDGVVLRANTTNPPYYDLFTPCRNGTSCKGENVMTRETSSDGQTCYVLGRWDPKKQPEYVSTNGGEWTFEYDNGDDDCGNPCRTWSPRFVCSPDVKYKVGIVYEIPGSCFYELIIETEFACSDWTTTTTTSVPGEECIFKSENGNHTLNMTSIKGKLLTSASGDIASLYYMYTPCVNSAECNDNTSVMAYIFDGMEFECKQYLAIWENGSNEANYIEEGVWQFTYTNGERCIYGGQTVFSVEWFCDKSATTPQVIQAKQIATCVYQMVIHSSLACE